MAPSHVLVPLDGSPLADDALDHALETFDCRVTVLNVVTPLDDRMSEGGSWVDSGATPTVARPHGSARRRLSTPQSDAPRRRDGLAA